jgi:glycosyltransferase involved in cell wall biosynthesis
MPASGNSLGKVVVIVRSYNRIDALSELLPIILRQSYSDFRLIVIEQSTKTTQEQYSPLRKLMAADSRIAIYPFLPLGGPMSRNEGARVANAIGGDILVFIDDE